MNKRSENLTPESKPSDEMDKGRREALKKLGIYGAYTTPALYVLLRSGEAAAQVCASGCFQY